ncbi:MAG: hypothetical protein ABMA13_01210 [Chthoniobacteraceae bacterium]
MKTEAKNIISKPIRLPAIDKSGIDLSDLPRAHIYSPAIWKIAPLAGIPRRRVHDLSIKSVGAKFLLEWREAPRGVPDCESIDELPEDKRREALDRWREQVEKKGGFATRTRSLTPGQAFALDAIYGAPKRWELTVIAALEPFLSADCATFAKAA